MEQRGDHVKRREENIRVNLAFAVCLSLQATAFMSSDCSNKPFKKGHRTCPTKTGNYCESDRQDIEVNIQSCHLCVLGLLLLTECSRLLPLSPVPLTAPGSYLFYLQLSAGHGGAEGGQAGSWLSKEATTSPSLLQDAADLFLLWTLALLVYVVGLQVILSYRPTFLLADHNRLGVICLRALFCPLTSSTCRTKWSCLSAGMLKLA